MKEVTDIPSTGKGLLHEHGESHLEAERRKRWYIWVSERGTGQLDKLIGDPYMAERLGLVSWKDSMKETVEDLDAYARDYPHQLPDIVVLAESGKDLALPEAIQAITRIRNNPHIKKQPFIITTSHFPEEVGSKKLAAGADLDVSEDDLIPIFLREKKTLSDLVNDTADILGERYGDRMFHHKQSFYAEYQGRLKDRAKITADTEQELRVLTDIFQKEGVRQVLDAGSGEGRIALPLAEAGYGVTGIDASEALVEKANQEEEKSGATFIVGDIGKLPVQKQTQDAIMYNWHVFCDLLGNKRKQKVLAEAQRALRDGGVVVLDIPDREQLEEGRDGVYLNNPGGENIFIGYVPSEEEMKQHLTDAGFQDIDVKQWRTAHGFPKLTIVARKQEKKA